MADRVYPRKDSRGYFPLHRKLLKNQEAFIILKNMASLY
jgi:hypothetical protein